MRRERADGKDGIVDVCWVESRKDVLGEYMLDDGGEL